MIMGIMIFYFQIMILRIVILVSIIILFITLTLVVAKVRYIFKPLDPLQYSIFGTILFIL